jgi:hypothetical protein
LATRITEGALSVESLCQQKSIVPLPRKQTSPLKWKEAGTSAKIPLLSKKSDHRETFKSLGDGR